MPTETHEAARSILGHRWLGSAIKTASEPLPALPFERANRSRPASLALDAPARSASVAAR